MYTLRPLNGGRRCRKPPNILRGAASARNTCNFWHANSTFASSVSLDSEFKLSSSSCVLGRLHLPPSLSRLSSTWIQLELRVYITRLVNGLCTSGLCLHGLHGQRRRADWFQRLSISRHSLFKQPSWANVAANPVEGSRLSPFSSTLVRSKLAMAKPVEEERLARGAPNHGRQPAPLNDRLCIFRNKF